MFTNQRGLSIVEVVIGAAIASITMAGMFQMIETSRTATGDLESKLGQLSLAQDIRLQISSPASCKAALKNTSINVNSGLLNVDFDLGNGRRVRQNEKIASDGVEVKSFQLRNVASVPGVSNVVVGDLFLDVQGTKGRKTRFREIPVGRMTITRNGNNIEGCGPMDVAAFPACDDYPPGSQSYKWNNPSGSKPPFPHGAKYGGNLNAWNYGVNSFTESTCVAGVWVANTVTEVTPNIPQPPGW